MKVERIRKKGSEPENLQKDARNDDDDYDDGTGQLVVSRTGVKKSTSCENTLRKSTRPNSIPVRCFGVV